MYSWESLKSELWPAPIPGSRGCNKDTMAAGVGWATRLAYQVSPRLTALCVIRTALGAFWNGDAKKKFSHYTQGQRGGDISCNIFEIG